MKRALALLAVVAGCGGLLPQRHGATYEARKRLTRELIARQDWAAAFHYADELHRLDPRDAEVLALRGTIYRERGLPAEAEADLGEALARRPDLAEAHAALGILLDTGGRGEAAEAHHRRAVALAPDDAGYLNNLGFSLYLRGRAADAVDAYQRAARLEPTSRRIRTNLGFAYAAAGDLPRAAREFELGGTAAEAKNNLGFAYERRGDLGNAFGLYEQALRLDPRSQQARANLAHVAAKLGRPLPPEHLEPAVGRAGGRGR